jgi:thioredoxin reductase
MKSDAEIGDDVINELYWDPQVTEPEAIGVAVRDGAVTLTGHVLAARALFVFIGVRPCSGSLGGLVDLDARGFVRTGQDTGSSALGSRPGIFAVGDVRSGSAKRVAAAVGEGAMAIRLAFERTRPG